MREGDKLVEGLRKHGIKHFYYLCKTTNVKSILKRGILSKHEVEKRGILKTEDFSNRGVQQLREKKNILFSDGAYHNLHDAVPLYFVTINPTLYARREEQNSLCYLCISVECLKTASFAFSDGNAANNITQFFHKTENLDQIPWERLRAKEWSWSDYEKRRQRNAEMLVYPKIEPLNITKILVNNQFQRLKILTIIKELDVECELRPEAFFPTGDSIKVPEIPKKEPPKPWTKEWKQKQPPTKTPKPSPKEVSPVKGCEQGKHQWVRGDGLPYCRNCGIEREY